MIGSLVRSVGAVLIGLVAAMILIVGVEGVGAILHPFPPDVDPTDYEVCKAHVARIPAWILLLVVLLWGLTTFLSVWLATRLGWGRHRAHGIVVGSILLALVIMNMSMLPYPVWFWASNLIVFPLATYCGAKLGGPRPAAAANEMVDG